MGKLTTGDNKGVALMVGILLVLTVVGSFVDLGTMANAENFRYLRF